VTRRELLAGLGGAAGAAWARPAWAQRWPLPVIGIISAGSADQFGARLHAFHEGLADFGYVEGRDFTVEHRWATGQYDRLATDAAELVDRKVALIGALGSGVTGALAAKTATATTPVLFIIGVDPVEAGLVASLNRPGGNVTGLTLLDAGLVRKHLELLRELVAGLAVIGLLANPANRNFGEVVRSVQDAAATVAMKVVTLESRSDDDFEPAFAEAVRHKAGALIVGADPFFNTRVHRIAALALRHAMPSLHSFRDFPRAGGLVSYGTDVRDAYRQMGSYAARILKGEMASDLPVLQPTRFELIINQGTARALGLTIPPTVLARADEVIE
jgi:putative ABC transport system substrate-binding protein